MAEKRIDIVSDTHGMLAPSLLAELAGADLIIHAGDLTSTQDVATLQTIAPLRACLGNNDLYYDYPWGIEKLVRFSVDGVRFAVAHYERDLPLKAVDVAVCGHTHRPLIEQSREGALIINPGSPTFPRSQLGPTMARLWIRDGKVEDASILQLPPEGRRFPW
jgi:hypothetical protein